MDVIMDLSARAVSFITLVQTMLLKGATEANESIEHLSVMSIPPGDIEELIKRYIALAEAAEISSYKFRTKPVSNSIKALSPGDEQALENCKNEPGTACSYEVTFTKRAVELVWISDKEVNTEVAKSYATTLAVALYKWLWRINSAETDSTKKIFTKLYRFGRFPSPYNWRSIISEFLYANNSDNNNEREKLAEVLQYLPLQVVLASGGCVRDFHQQRLQQLYKCDDVTLEAILSPADEKFYKEHTIDDSRVTKLLNNLELLKSELLLHQVSLPFEMIYRDELSDILRNRDFRKKEILVAPQPLQTDGTKKNENSSVEKLIVSSENEKYECKDNPFETATSMQLKALAFSGGGIRSATFNLGILQGLAEKGIINQFDYLSTVSGGGYIGSWLATWIKREGSVVKVNNRLNAQTSPEPRGEEVRPIRWLRMFSNYFAPDSSIMSLDSWTIGMTWLRNTLLNQVIIFALLLGLLFGGNFFYNLWENKIHWDPDVPALQVLVISCLFFIPLALWIGQSMSAYSSDSSKGYDYSKRKGSDKSDAILILLLVISYMISGWLFSRDDLYIEYNTTLSRLNLIYPGLLLAILLLFFISVKGNYQQCIQQYKKNYFLSIIILFVSSVVAIVAGAITLTQGWKLVLLIAHRFPEILKKTEPFLIDPEKAIPFVLGVPFVIFVFGFTVIVRMALLGKYFPDERREWWGRMGAKVNRAAFIWLILSGSALLGQTVFTKIFPHTKVLVSAGGGWVAIVFGTVKAAFSSKTSGPGEKKDDTFSIFLNALGIAGPYIFMLGLLIFLPGLIEPLLKREDFLLQKIPVKLDPIWQTLILFVFFVGIAYLLAWRIGVNEFSMHHFYRNRLVRAYLGATKRRTDRERTANPFTRFDRKDDEKLFEFTSMHGYRGPYPLLNTALNASASTSLDRQDRKAESFIFSPLYCGFDFSRVRPSGEANSKAYDYAYRFTQNFAYKHDNGPSIGTALAVSGAAINPNQGYHSSPGTAFLLSIFNVQMGWWIGNPRKSYWQNSDPRNGFWYIIKNLVGQTDSRSSYLNLSDGGHFDNMGLYELVRRKCKFILLSDAEQDINFTCEGLANAIRRCRIDFGVEINISIEGITKRNKSSFSDKHYSIGTIKYPGDEEIYGTILYIKASVTGDESVDIEEYASKNETFPQQSTSDQFFNEEQFESYRKLGLHIIQSGIPANWIDKIREADYKWFADEAERIRLDNIQNRLDSKV